MQTLSTYGQGTIRTEADRVTDDGLDHAVWLPGAAFAASAGALALGQAPLGLALGAAAAASAGSVLTVLARGAGRLRAPLLLDRVLQGCLYAALLWIAQLAVAGALPVSAGLVVTGLAVLAVFMVLSAVETLAAGALCLSARGGLSGCIAAAAIVDNRAFASLGALRR